MPARIQLADVFIVAVLISGVLLILWGPTIFALHKSKRPIFRKSGIVILTIEFALLVAFVWLADFAGLSNPAGLILGCSVMVSIGGTLLVANSDGINS